MLRKVCFLAAFAAATVASSFANADVLHSLNMQGAASADGVANPAAFPPGVNNAPTVRVWEVQARSYVGFQDNDASFGISTGDTFRDFIAVTVGGYTLATPNDVTPSAFYGNNPNIHTH